MNRPLMLEKVDTVATPVLGASNTFRLLNVVAGGQEFLLRPECVRSINQLAVQDRNNLNFVETPDGTVPTLSLIDCLKRNLGYSPTIETKERTVIVFRNAQSSFGLRVQSVSRPVEIDSAQVFNLPPIAHPSGQASVLDSIALVQDQNLSSSEAIRIVIDPLVAIGFRDQAQSLASPSGTTNGDSFKSEYPDRRNDDPFLRARKRDEQKDSRGNSQLLAFSPRTPLPVEMFFRFCLPMSAISEVLMDQNVFPVPSAGSALSGFLVWRSQPIPVIDLGIAFGANGASNPLLHSQSKGRILIAKLPGGFHVAIPTEMQIQVLRTPRTSSVDFLAITDMPHLGAFPDSTCLLVVPDLNRILQGN